MTDLEKQYRECAAQILVRSADRANALSTIASEFRKQGRYLAAAICSLDGHLAAWGIDPPELCSQLLLDSTNDLLQFLRDDASNDWAGLLALDLLVHNCSGGLFSGDTALQLAQLKDSARADYYSLLSGMARGHVSEGPLLVSGFQLRGSLDGPWEPVFPGFEVMSALRTTSHDGTTHTRAMDSGFRCLLSLGDYDGALKVSRAHEDSLISPGLRGWSIASSALLNGDPRGFADASAQFQLDSSDRAKRNKSECWIGINQQLWAPYFSSRSHMAAPCSTPTDATTAVRRATESAPQAVGWHVPQVSRYFQVLHAIRGMADGDAGAVNTAIQEYRTLLRLDLPTSLDDHVMAFLGHIQSLSDVSLGGDWIEPLSEVLALLDRLPFLATTEKSTIKSTLSLAVPATLLELRQGWIHRALMSIKDERQLHRILLALFRSEATVPSFSQLRHGPIEFGKDIAVCRTDGARQVLSMYSVKLGEINKRSWNLEVRPQLEEMFQVPLDSPELPDEIDERIGVLVWNNHLGPHIEPVVEGWLKEQTCALGRKYELWHIDRLVRYIEDNCLHVPLREALRTEGLLP